MFCHELSYIKNGDYIKKRMMMAVDCIFWFNLLIKHFREQLFKWSETECDYKTVELLGGEVTVGEYFDTLLGIIQHSGRENMWLISTASESKEEWERRFRLIDGSLQVKDIKSTIAVSIILLALLLNNTAYAAGLQVNKLNAQLAMDNVVETKEVNTTVAYEETIEYLSEEEMAAIPVDESVVIPTADGWFY